MVRDSKFKTIMMGLACGRIGREGMYTDDYLCCIANLFWFYVGSEWTLTFLPKTVVLRKKEFSFKITDLKEHK